MINFDQIDHPGPEPSLDPTEAQPSRGPGSGLGGAFKTLAVVPKPDSIPEPRPKMVQNLDRFWPDFDQI